MFALPGGVRPSGCACIQATHCPVHSSGVGDSRVVLGMKSIGVASEVRSRLCIRRHPTQSEKRDVASAIGGQLNQVARPEAHAERLSEEQRLSKGFYLSR